MVIQHIKVPGDIFYPDYSRILDIEVGTEEVIKGDIYTIGSDGKLYEFGEAITDVRIPGTTTLPIIRQGETEYPDEPTNNYATSGVETMAQPMRNAEKGDIVQCLMPGSRIGVKIDGTAVPGDVVAWAVSKTQAAIDDSNLPAFEPKRAVRIGAPLDYELEGEITALLSHEGDTPAVQAESRFPSTGANYVSIAAASDIGEAGNDLYVQINRFGGQTSGTVTVSWNPTASNNRRSITLIVRTGDGALTPQILSDAIKDAMDDNTLPSGLVTVTPHADSNTNRGNIVVSNLSSKYLNADQPGRDALEGEDHLEAVNKLNNYLHATSGRVLCGIGRVWEPYQDDPYGQRKPVARAGETVIVEMGEL